MNSKDLGKEFLLKELGEEHYNWYLLLTQNEKYTMPVQSKYHLMYALLTYRESLLNVGRGQDVTIEQLEKYFNEDNDKALKESLQQVFQEYFSDNKFKAIKQDLNEKDGWTIKKIMKVHKKDKCRRLLSILQGDVNATCKEYEEVIA